MKPSFAPPLLIGILIGVITSGIIIVARDDFFWYRKTTTESSADSSIDAVFIEEMIPHHEGAIEMAKIALAKAKTEEVRNLAQSIIDAQEEEITQMRAWYKTWFGKDIPEKSPLISMHGMGSMHMGTMSGDLAALSNAKNIDETFLQQMIPHHEMAVMMAQMLLHTTTREEMKALAEKIIETQSAEIEDMRTWLGDIE
jgi:uncharacterized protein (DUF305 family)